MLHFELLRTRNILIVAPDGPLEKSDFEDLAREIEPILESKGRLTGLLVYADKFPGWKNVYAFAAHLGFIARHHGHIDRIAALTNSRPLKAMARFAGCVVKAEIKHFDLEHETQALAWLETGSLQRRELVDAART